MKISKLLKQSASNDIASGLFARMIGGLSSLIMINLLVSGYGPEQAGVLVLLTGIPSLFKIFDLGISSGLLSRVLDLRLRNGLVQRYHFKIFLTLNLTIAFIVLVISMALLPVSSEWAVFSPISDSLKVTDWDLGQLLALSFFFGCIALVTDLANSIAWGLGLGYKSNWTSTVTDVIVISMLVLMNFSGPQLSLQWVILIILGVPVLGNIALGFMLGKSSTNDQTSDARVKSLFIVETKRVYADSWAYAVIAFSGIIAYQTDSLIVNTYFGPSGVLLIAIVWKVCGMIPLALDVLAKPLWVELASLIHKYQVVEFKRKLFKYTYFVGAVSGLSAIVVFFLRDQVFGILTPSFEGEIENSILLGGLLFAVVSSIDGPVSMALNAIKAYRQIALTGIAMSITNLTLGILITPYVGVGGPLWASFLSLGLVGFLYNYYVVSKWMTGMEQE